MKVAIDTNLLVRYLTWDDEAQATGAAAVIEKADAIVISTIVLCETAWVLRRAYGYEAKKIASALGLVIESRGVEVDREAAEAGLAFLIKGGDFADGVILCQAERAKCDHLATFDRALAQLAEPSKVLLLGRSTG